MSPVTLESNKLRQDRHDGARGKKQCVPRRLGRPDGRSRRGRIRGEKGGAAAQALAVAPADRLLHTPKSASPWRGKPVCPSPTCMSDRDGVPRALPSAYALRFAAATNEQVRVGDGATTFRNMADKCPPRILRSNASRPSPLPPGATLVRGTAPWGASCSLIHSLALHYPVLS